MHVPVNNHSELASILVALIYPMAILLLAYAYVWALFNLARWLGSLV